MRTINLILTMLLVCFGVAAQAANGNDHGNGGGVICVNNRCQTLADAGLIINPEYPDFWLPSESVIRAINDYVNRYPFAEDVRNSIRQQILLKLTHFRVVQVIDPAKLEMIKQFYIDTIKQSSPNFDFTNFKIVAMSSDNSTKEQYTYLLPDFMNLAREEQAKMLIHEGLYRGRPSSDLKHILQLESALSKFTTNDVRGDFLMSAQIAAWHLKIIDNSSLLAHIIFSTYANAYEYGKFRSIGFFTETPAFGSLYQIIFQKDEYFLNFNLNYIHQTADKDMRTAVLLLNLPSSIKLKKVLISGFSKFDYAPDLGLVFGVSGNVYLTIAEPEKLELLLPK